MWRRNNPGRRRKGHQRSEGSAAENRGRRRVVAAENGWGIERFERGLFFH